MKNRNEQAKRSVFKAAGRLAAAMVTLIVGGAVWSVVPAHCVALDVPAPFVLPDGSVHAAGELRMCLSRNFNPVMGLHRVYIDGMPVGFLLSQIANAEIPKDTTPSALFYGASGRLRLVGYTVAANGKVFSYLLWNGRAASGVAAAPNSGGENEAPPEHESHVLLAARLE